MNNSQKNISDLERLIPSIQVDYDFYNTGFEFEAVEPKSANHLLGNGKWKKAVIQSVGEDVFMKSCDKYGNKPIDFKVACLKTPQAPYFAYNEVIIIKDKNNKYSGEYRVLAVEDGCVCVMLPFVGDSSGIIINKSRKAGAENALKKNIQMLNDLKPLVKEISNILPMENTSTESVEKSTKSKVHSPGMLGETFWTKNSGRNKKIAIGLGIVAALVASYFIYIKFKPKK